MRRGLTPRAEDFKAVGAVNDIGQRALRRAVLSDLIVERGVGQPDMSAETAALSALLQRLRAAAGFFRQRGDGCVKRGIPPRGAGVEDRRFGKRQCRARRVHSVEQLVQRDVLRLRQLLFQQIRAGGAGGHDLRPSHGLPCVAQFFQVGRLPLQIARPNGAGPAAAEHHAGRFRVSEQPPRGKHLIRAARGQLTAGEKQSCAFLPACIETLAAAEVERTQPVIVQPGYPFLLLPSILSREPEKRAEVDALRAAVGTAGAEVAGIGLPRQHAVGQRRDGIRCGADLCREHVRALPVVRHKLAAGHARVADALHAPRGLGLRLVLRVAGLRVRRHDARRAGGVRMRHVVAFAVRIILPDDQSGASGLEIGLQQHGQTAGGGDRLHQRHAADAAAEKPAGA